MMRMNTRQILLGSGAGIGLLAVVAFTLPPNDAATVPDRYRVTAGAYDVIMDGGVRLHFDSFVRIDTITGRSWLMQYQQRENGLLVPEWMPIGETTIHQTPNTTNSIKASNAPRN